MAGDKYALSSDRKKAPVGPAPYELEGGTSALLAILFADAIEFLVVLFLVHELTGRGVTLV
jgi:hypothetical protein